LEVIPHQTNYKKKIQKIYMNRKDSLTLDITKYTNLKQNKQLILMLDIEVKGMIISKKGT